MESFKWDDIVDCITNRENDDTQSWWCFSTISREILKCTLETIIHFCESQNDERAIWKNLFLYRKPFKTQLSVKTVHFQLDNFKLIDEQTFSMRCDVFQAFIYCFNCYIIYTCVYMCVCVCVCIFGKQVCPDTVHEIFPSPLKFYWPQFKFVILNRII